MTQKISKNTFQRVFIVGYGDIGRRVAALLESQNGDIIGLARSQVSAEQMKKDGVAAVSADLDNRESLPGMPEAGYLLYYFAPPPPSGVIDTRMTNFLKSLSDNTMPAKIVYISTSGVYGDQGGRQVTEATVPCPGADRSRRRLDAETQLNNYAALQSIDLVILRVAGIYGPGRLPEQRIRDRVPVLQEELAPKTNRIHADDLASICVAAAEYGKNTEIYNISDGCGSTMTQYFFQIADFLKLPRPPTLNWQEAEQKISASMLSYLRESRSMDNSKMLEDLRIVLKYPDLSTGLDQIRQVSNAKP